MLWWPPGPASRRLTHGTRHKARPHALLPSGSQRSALPRRPSACRSSSSSPTMPGLETSSGRASTTPRCHWQSLSCCSWRWANYPDVFRSGDTRPECPISALANGVAGRDHRQPVHLPRPLHGELSRRLHRFPPRHLYLPALSFHRSDVRWLALISRLTGWWRRFPSSTHCSGGARSPCTACRPPISGFISALVGMAVCLQ